MSRFVFFFSIVLLSPSVFSQSAMRSLEAVVSARAGTASAAIVECPLIVSASDVSRLRPTTQSPQSCVETVLASDRSLIVTETHNYRPLRENQHRLMVQDHNRFYQTGNYLLKRLSRQKLPGSPEFKIYFKYTGPRGSDA
jgi:hypothetical protein